MIKLLCIVALFGCWLNAAAVQLQPHHPNRYVVQSGDTLWDIAGKFLKYPWQWSQVWQNNPGVTTPHSIYPGDVLVLTQDQNNIKISAHATGGTIKLSPHMRHMDQHKAITTIPLAAIKPFLSRTRLIDAKEFATAPYIVALAHQDRITSSEGDNVFVRNLPGATPTHYGVYRRESIYIDPKSKKILGYQGQYIAELQLTHYADPANFLVLSSPRELRIGDRLFHQEATSPSYFVPTAAPKNLKGTIMGVEDGVTQIGSYSIVAINLGSSQAVVPGSVFAIQKPGRKIIDKLSPNADEIQLPGHEIGTLMVFKSYHDVSYALVMRAQEAIQVGEQIISPTA